MRVLTVLAVMALVGSTARAQTGAEGTAEADGSVRGSTAQQPPPPQQPPAPPPQTNPTPPPPREEPGDGRSADLLWIEGAFGYSHVDLVRFEQDNFLPNLGRVKGSGFGAAAAAGVRIAFVMIGARGTLSSYEGFDLWTIGGEVHLRLPLPTIEPYVRLGAGYAFVGRADYRVPEASEADVFGLMLDAGLGLDIYLDKIFAFGVGVDGAWLNLTRQRVDTDGCAEPTCGTMDVDLSEDGDAAGYQLRAHVHASLHF